MESANFGRRSGMTTVDKIGRREAIVDNDSMDDTLP